MSPRRGGACEIDFHELEDRVKERLDAVFPDDRVPPDASLGEGKAEALGQLQAIMGELQLGPVHTLEAFAQELERVKPAFAENNRRMLALSALQAGSAGVLSISLAACTVRQPLRLSRASAPLNV